MTQALSPALAPPPRINWTDWLQRPGALAALILIAIIFSARRPETFPTLFNFKIMLKQTAVVATAAWGMTMIIISGGIDISVASTIALVTMVTAALLDRGWTPF